MVTEDPPWEPPYAGTDVEQLLGALNRLRWTFRWKADGLDVTQLRRRIEPSPLSLAGLLKHLAFVEDYTFTTKLTGESPGEPWQSADWSGGGGWDFRSAAGDTAEDLYALWDAAVARAQGRLAAAIGAGGLDQPAHLVFADGRHASLRRLVCDQIEEYGRHTGHADLLREAVDGRVGEDPPSDWRPVSGTGLAT
jgi:hypothetical protein